jgi:hypothetical protein
MPTTNRLTKIEDYEEVPGQDTNRNKDKELIQRLNAKTKEQQNMRDEQSSAVTEFLKILTTVKKLQGNLAQISKRVACEIMPMIWDRWCHWHQRSQWIRFGQHGQ